MTLTQREKAYLRRLVLSDQRALYAHSNANEAARAVTRQALALGNQVITKLDVPEAAEPA